MLIFTNHNRTSIVFALQPRDRIYDVASAIETAHELGARVFLAQTGNVTVDKFISRIQGVSTMTCPIDNQVYKTSTQWEEGAL